MLVHRMQIASKLDAPHKDISDLEVLLARVCSETAEVVDPGLTLPKQSYGNEFVYAVNLLQKQTQSRLLFFSLLMLYLHSVHAEAAAKDEKVPVLGRSDTSN